MTHPDSKSCDLQNSRLMIIRNNSSAMFGLGKYYHPDRKYSEKRSSKRGFRGNQYTKLAPKTTTDVNVITDSAIFSQIVAVLCCPNCRSKPTAQIYNTEGLSFSLKILCRKCGILGDLRNSKNMTEDGRSPHQVNVRSALATKLIGQNLKGLQRFCAYMNMPPPVSKATFNSYTKVIMERAEQVAKESMIEAAKEETELSSSKDLTVSGDGSWRKMGFQSLQGIGTLIGWRSGKVIDAIAKNSTCKMCDYKRSILAPDQFEDWERFHAPECSRNHRGNAGRMEVDSMVEMFRRSEQRYGVRYVRYIGDGDSKTFKHLTDASPYSSVIIEKKECTGHVQKRMGTRLRNLKKEAKIKGGRARAGEKLLTGGYIDTLSAYYGKAIRENCDSIEKMTEAIWAVFYHESSTNAAPKHDLCPKGVRSWCKYQRSIAEGTTSSFNHKPTLSPATWDLLKPIFEKLTERELLSRCIGGYTQNRNESLNSSIWRYAPKKTYSGPSSLRIAVAFATVKFNDGSTSINLISSRLGLLPNEFMNAFASEEDRVRRSCRADSCNQSSNPSDDDSDSDGAIPYGAGIAD